MRISPPALFVASVVAMLAVAVLAPGPRLVADPWTLAGLVPVVAGVWLHRAAWRAFGDRGTTTRALGRPTELVESGVFAWTRNPMYVAGLSILTGVGVLLGHVVPFAVIPTYAVLTRLWFLEAEERALEVAFGDRYLAYRSRVRRWL